MYQPRPGQEMEDIPDDFDSREVQSGINRGRGLFAIKDVDQICTSLLCDQPDAQSVKQHASFLGSTLTFIVEVKFFIWAAHFLVIYYWNEQCWNFYLNCDELSLTCKTLTLGTLPNSTHNSQCPNGKNALCGISFSLVLKTVSKTANMQILYPNLIELLSESFFSFFLAVT